MVFEAQGRIGWDAMAKQKKKKKKVFRATKAVKEMARDKIGSPPPSRLVPHKKRPSEKHKPTMGKLLAED